MQEIILHFLQVSQRLAAVVHDFENDPNFGLISNLIQSETKLSSDFLV